MFARRQPTFVVILMVAIALPTRSLRAQPFDREHPSPIELERPRWLPTAGDLEALLAAFDVPGLALVGLANCTVTPAITVGSATLDPATPVTGTTLFEAASLSKPVFAYLVMQLVDEGALDLDRPLAHDFAYPRIEEHENYARITPRMILAHRTGLPNWVGDTDDPDRTDRIAFVAPPGTRFSYSGEAYELLRRYVEFITDRTLDELFRERLGHIMPASTFELPPPMGTAPSRGYASSREPHSGRSLSDLGGAAGGLLTTADDYARFLELVCSGDGLSENARRTMLAPQSPVPSGRFPVPTSWALGWAVMDPDDANTVIHTGDNGEYRSIAAIFPGEHSGLVVLTNGRNGGDLIDALIAILE